MVYHEADTGEIASAHAVKRLDALYGLIHIKVGIFLAELFCYRSLPEVSAKSKFTNGELGIVQATRKGTILAKIARWNRSEVVATCERLGLNAPKQTERPTKLS